jgi:hypothetical protein
VPCRASASRETPLECLDPRWLQYLQFTTDIQGPTWVSQIYVGFEVITAVAMDVAIFWDIAQCLATCCTPASRSPDFLPDDRSDKLLRNVGSQMDCTALYLRHSFPSITWRRKQVTNDSTSLLHPQSVIGFLTYSEKMAQCFGLPSHSQPSAPNITTHITDSAPPLWSSG